MERSGQKRPQPGEIPGYAQNYVDLVPGSDPVAVLRSQIDDTMALLHSFGEEAGELRYQPGKWTPKDVLAHVTDTERIFQYRILRIARGDCTPLPGFDQELYARNANANARPLDDLAAEYRIVRQSTLFLLERITPSAWERRGEANGVVVSVRGLAFLAAGHELHHVKILRERYAVGSLSAQA